MVVLALSALAHCPLSTAQKSAQPVLHKMKEFCWVSEKQFTQLRRLCTAGETEGLCQRLEYMVAALLFGQHTAQSHWILYQVQTLDLQSTSHAGMGMTCFTDTSHKFSSSVSGYDCKNELA